MDNKEKLLLWVEKAADYINQKNCGNFTDMIINMINVSKDVEGSEVVKKQKFFKLLYLMKTANIELLGGGNAVKEGYKDFIDNYIHLSKGKNSFIIENNNIRDLTLDEYHYIFVWLRRLVKSNDSGNKGNNNSNTSGKVSGNNRNHNKNSKGKNKKNEVVYSTKDNSKFNNPFEKLQALKF